MRVVQGCLSTGFGGLELVMMEFHQWLLRQNVDAKVIILRGSRLHQEFENVLPKDSVITVPDSFFGKMKARQVRQDLDSPNTAHLFHRHRGLKGLLLNELEGNVTVLNHTFMSVEKKDFLHRRVFSRVDRWVALTPLHRLNLHESLDVPLESIHVIPNGVEIEKFQVTESRKSFSGPLKLGVIARLDCQKGQDIAIQALRKLQDQSVDAELYLFGEDTPDDQPFSPFLKNLASELGVSSRVHFKGFCRLIQEDLKGIDILWMPSHKETFGRCIIEAMAARVPVIASAAGGVVDIIRDRKNGILFRTKDVNDLAAQTLVLVKDHALREQIVDAAYSDVRENYDQRKIWQRLYSCICGEPVIENEFFQPSVNWIPSIPLTAGK